MADKYNVNTTSMFPDAIDEPIFVTDVTEELLQKVKIYHDYIDAENYTAAKAYLDDETNADLKQCMLSAELINGIQDKLAQTQFIINNRAVKTEFVTDKTQPDQDIGEYWHKVLKNNEDGSMQVVTYQKTDVDTYRQICVDAGTRKADTNVGRYSFVSGINNTASGYYSHAEGDNTAASAIGAHAEGVGTFALGGYSHAEGKATHSQGTYSHAEGNNTNVTGDNAHVEGKSSVANGTSSHAEGTNSITEGESAHAEGENTNAKKTASHAEGSGTATNGIASHAEGKATTATGQASHSEGLETKSTGINSHAEGNKTRAGGVLMASGDTGGNAAHAEGYYTYADEDYSHTEGNYTNAFSESGHAEGVATTVMGNGAHAEGVSTGEPYLIRTRIQNLPAGTNPKDTWKTSKDFSVAYGQGSHAEGLNTLATGQGSHAEGEKTHAGGHNAHAEGLETEALSDEQHVEGRYNESDVRGLYAHIVGGGTDNSNRKNIYTLDWDGNAIYEGDLVINKNISLLDFISSIQGDIKDLHLLGFLSQSEEPDTKDQNLGDLWFDED